MKNQNNVFDLLDVAACSECFIIKKTREAERFSLSLRAQVGRKVGIYVRGRHHLHSIFLKEVKIDWIVLQWFFGIPLQLVFVHLCRAGRRSYPDWNVFGARICNKKRTRKTHQNNIHPTKNGPGLNQISYTSSIGYTSSIRLPNSLDSPCCTASNCS